MQRARLQGLLSQALSKLGRGPSLSNLLDGFEVDVAKMLAALPAENSGNIQELAAAAAGGDARDPEVESHASVKKPRQKAQAQWKGKQEVIDSLNELIDELENIKTSITAQGVEHIHANEVGEGSSCPQARRSLLACACMDAEMRPLFVRESAGLTRTSPCALPSRNDSVAGWLQVILTLGMSDTTFLFLKEASKKREFQVGGASPKGACSS